MTKKRFKELLPRRPAPKSVAKFKVVMIFDMSWGSRSRLTRLSHRTSTPRGFLSNVRHFGYFARGRFIPAARLLEAYIRELPVVKA